MRFALVYFLLSFFAARAFAAEDLSRYIFVLKDSIKSCDDCLAEIGSELNTCGGKIESFYPRTYSGILSATPHVAERISTLQHVQKVRIEGILYTSLNQAGKTIVCNSEQGEELFRLVAEQVIPTFADKPGESEFTATVRLSKHRFEGVFHARNSDGTTEYSSMIEEGGNSYSIDLGFSPARPDVFWGSFFDGQKIETVSCKFLNPSLHSAR